MYMRFSLQYFNDAHGRFERVREKAVSPLIYVGRGLRRGRQHGFTFALGPPTSRYLLRGRTEFFWYRRKRRPNSHRSRLVLVKRRDLVTRGGKKHVRGGDPRGYSAGTCDLR